MIARAKLLELVIQKLTSNTRSSPNSLSIGTRQLTIRSNSTALTTCRLEKTNTIKQQRILRYYYHKRIISSLSEPKIRPMDQPASLKNRVIVRDLKDEQLLRILLTLDINGNCVLINLSRERGELLQNCFQRLKFNIVKRKNKGKKTRGTDEETEDISLCMLKRDGQIFDIQTTTNDEAWTDGNILQIDGRNLVISVNEPQVKSLHLTKNIMAGFYVIPRIQLDFCSFQDCKYAWYRQMHRTDREFIKEQQKNEVNSKNEQAEVHKGGSIFWMKVSDSLVYHPSMEDLGRLLKFCCLPVNGSRLGFQEECISVSPVELGPGPCPFEKRHQFTKYPCDNPEQFRVVTYNILADLYADSDYSRDVLFKYCASYALHIEYRKQLFYKELIGYNADIICLQEVDAKVFRNDLLPSLCLAGNECEFKGVFNSKGGLVAEGVALFYRDTRFQLVTSWSAELSRLIDPKRTIVIEPEEEPSSANLIGDATLNNNSKAKIDSIEDITTANGFENSSKLPTAPITDDSGGCLADLKTIREALQQNSSLAKRFLNRHTIVQITLLRSKDNSNKALLIANTHLYFHPDADHIRLLQGSVIVKYIEFVKNYISNNSNLFMVDNDESSSASKQLDLSVIFCGDLNSTPDCGLYRLVTNGDVPETLDDWQSNKDEAVEGLSLSTSLRLTSAYGKPNYTNYTPDFNGCLDYIYYSHEQLECKQIVPMPDHEDVIKYQGLPSIVFPSDHLALIADLSWIPSSSSS